jgi:hypothetical protein
MVKDGLGGLQFTLSLSERESHSQDRSDQGPFHSPRPQGFRNLKYQHQLEEKKTQHTLVYILAICWLTFIAQTVSVTSTAFTNYH